MRVSFVDSIGLFCGHDRALSAESILASDFSMGACLEQRASLSVPPYCVGKVGPFYGCLSNVQGPFAGVFQMCRALLPKMWCSFGGNKMSERLFNARWP